MLLFWLLFGALVGAYAAQRRGGGSQQRKCPYCAEWVKLEATVCKHCHKSLPPTKRP